MDLRSFLVQLREQGELIDIRDPVGLDYEVGAICRRLSDQRGPAALLHKVGTSFAPLLINVYGTRRRLALALGMSEQELLSGVAQRLKSRVPTELREDVTAPC